MLAKTQIEGACSQQQAKVLRLDSWPVSSSCSLVQGGANWRMPAAGYSTPVVHLCDRRSRMSWAVCRADQHVLDAPGKLIAAAASLWLGGMPVLPPLPSSLASNLQHVCLWHLHALTSRPKYGHWACPYAQIAMTCQLLTSAADYRRILQQGPCSISLLKSSVHSGTGHALHVQQRSCAQVHAGQLIRSCYSQDVTLAFNGSYFQVCTWH